MQTYVIKSGSKKSISQFFIYENYPTDKAMLHKSECSFCKNGQGKKGEAETSNGKWHGPFDDRLYAVKVLENLNRTDTRLCAICCP